MIDSATKRQIKTAADEIAARNGCRFDDYAADYVCKFFRTFLRHSSGEWAGQPFELLDWQRDELIRPLFGWKRKDGLRRFRKAYVELPKKNGKSTLASGIGLYLLVGDREPGAEVYSAATTQSQASIVHREAINMVDASRELSKALVVNRSTRNIHFTSTNSFYRSLSGESRGSEGLKAHGIIADELHVWHGRALWDSLKYAFRTRRQPLLFVITTAGDDLQSVCYEQHEYAKAILDGHNLDERQFAYIRAADIADDWADPAIWHKANPSLGITLKLDDFAADVAEAAKTPTAVASFKRYSLNIWATSTNPWLHLQDWLACRGEFDEADLFGRECYAALDLSKNRDMTCLALIFPGGVDQYNLLTYFWLPEETVNDPDSPEQFRVWEREGRLEVTPGSACDYHFIKRRLGELAQKFKIQELAYDPYRAEMVTQEIEDEFGIPRIEFGQTITNFAGPTEEFERLLLRRGIVHNGHPILTWQAGHVSVKTDANGNKRPVKPPHGDNRKIDGIVASIMALGRAMVNQGEYNPFETREIVFL